MSAMQRPRFMAFRLPLSSSSTRMWPGEVPASLAPRGAGSENIDRNGISAGVGLLWDH